MGILNKLFGIQDCASVHGEQLDWMLELIHWFMAVLFVGWSIFLVYVLVRYHRRNNPQAIHSGVKSHASSHLEVGVIIVEVVLLLGFAFPLWGQRVDDIPVDPDVQVRAVGQQFSWTFHYPGVDGKFGNTSPFNYSGSNPAGIDPDDPNGKDDVTAAELVLPVKKKIVIGVTSKDVIHNLALKAARMATDANPGQMNRIWFIPTKVGESEIICGQLCGPGHANMLGKLRIVSDKEYGDWAKEQNTFGGGTAAETPAAPTGGATAPAADSVEIAIGVIPGVLKFDKAGFEVRSGQKVKLVIKNEKDPIPHNIMIGKPGSVEKMTSAANAGTSNPDYMTKMQCFPESPDILFKGTKLVNPGQSDVLEFVAPEAGEYPYICGFPGHPMLMRGIMKVTK
ncbi:MAG: hypothetical protein KA004_10695 [Verrucomicrobiales bacterium]|nr:hypothetical protein [Verrucomicrobiales bacterium]